MAYLNLANLPTATFKKAETRSEYVRLYSEQPKHHIFLSYRHADRQYVTGVTEFIKRLGKGIYVDFLDEELVQAPSNQTAAILRQRIMQSKKLVQLITPNSGQSKWMPWELGLGDGLLGYPNSVILPTINGTQKVTDQDYLRMYGYIEKGPSADDTFQDWLIRYPAQPAKWFKNWIVD